MTLAEGLLAGRVAKALGLDRLGTGLAPAVG